MSEKDAARRADAGSCGEVEYSWIFGHLLAVQVQDQKGAGVRLTQPNMNPYGPYGFAQRLCRGESGEVSGPHVGHLSLE